MSTTTIGVIGCGYWGPNLLRNFAENEAAQLLWMCDTDAKRLDTVSRRYPAIRAAIQQPRKALTDGHAALRVVRLLKAAQASISEDGRPVKL